MTECVENLFILNVTTFDLFPELLRDGLVMIAILLQLANLLLGLLKRLNERADRATHVLSGLIGCAFQVTVVDGGQELLRVLDDLCLVHVSIIGELSCERKLVLAFESRACRERTYDTPEIQVI